MKFLFECSAVLALSTLSFAQQATAPLDTLQSDTVFIAGLWDQSSTPPVSGKLGYAHRIPSGNTFSYTALSFTVQKAPLKFLSTQETGLCQYTGETGGFHTLLCGTVGIVESQSSTLPATVNLGFVPGGTVLLTRPLGKGWWLGIAPSVSKATTSPDVQYAIGLVVGWGK